MAVRLVEIVGVESMKYVGIAQRMGTVAITCGMAFAQSAAPIPDPVALMKDLEAHQLRMDEVRENFAYREITQTDEVEKSGKVKSTSSEEHELFFVNGHRIRRLVKKNGVPLSAGAEKDEQNRVRKLVEKRSKEPRGQGGVRRDSDVSVSIRSLLEVMRITNPRRVMLNGRDTIAYDFTGDRKAKASGMGQNIARKLTGTVWIDDKDRQVARLEAQFGENFKIGGGLLVSVQAGTSIKLDQAPVGQGLWMPSVSELHLAARAFLVNSIRQDLHVRDFDFQRFDTSTQHVIQPPVLNQQRER